MAECAKFIFLGFWIVSKVRRFNEGLTVYAIVPLFVFLNKKAVAEKLISYCLPEIFTHT